MGVFFDRYNPIFVGMARNDLVKVTRGDKVRQRPRRVADDMVKNRGWHYADPERAAEVAAPTGGEDPNPTQAMLRKIATAPAPWLDEQIGIWSIWTKAAQERLDALAGGGPRPADDPPKDPPPPGPRPADDPPKREADAPTFHEMPAGDALKAITGMDDPVAVANGLVAEERGKNRKTVKAAAQKRIKQLTK